MIMLRKVYPQPGPQEEFLRSLADIVIYGGAAGGGKSYALLMEAMRYIKNPLFGAVAFRRTSPQISAEGGLWDTAGSIYPGAGGRMLDGIKEVRFDSGARISFRHLQHEKDKYNWQGSQIPLILFDELTHFTESQFWYLLSRNRSTCGVRPYVRATCNPEAGHWVFHLIQWWIDPSTGLPIKERAGVVRWFTRVGSELHWADTEEQLRDEIHGCEPKSLTFIPSTLDDNPALLKADPGYRANLLSLPRIERERLLYGNWIAREDSVIDAEWLRPYEIVDNGAAVKFQRQDTERVVGTSSMLRFATVDTAGTSKEKAAEQRGRSPSFSCCGVWDYEVETDSLFLRFMWRDQVAYPGLKRGVEATLREYNVRTCYIENKHFGPALASEIHAPMCAVELAPAKLADMRDHARDAKLERAIASGLLTRMEFGGFFVPETTYGPWVQDYINECCAWTGLRDETSDQIDVSSYAAYFAGEQVTPWGGVV